MLNVKIFKSIVINLTIMGLLQLELGVILSLMPSYAYALDPVADATLSAVATTAPKNMDMPTKPGVNPNQVNPNSAQCQPNANGQIDPKCKGINQTTEDWKEAADKRKQGYTLPPSEIERLKKQAERNEKILNDNERLINSFYSALSALGIDAMEEAANNIELLTAKLKTDTKALMDHTAEKLKPAIANFESATNIPLVPPIGGVIGGLAYVATGPKANKAVSENSKLSDKVYDSSNQLWDGVDKMNQANEAAFGNAMAIAQQTKADAINLLKTSVNDSYELTKDATEREFQTDMITNTDILGVSTASCLDLDCSNLGDSFSVSYHLFKAASAIYLSTTVRLISAYNENQADIMKSTPNEEGKFDTQTEQTMIAENIRGESVDFGDKIKAAKTVLEAMWARVLEVAQLELRQKELREAAEEAQASPESGGAAPAMEDAADAKADHSKKKKNWMLLLTAAAAAGYFYCTYNETNCGGVIKESNKQYWIMGIGAGVLLLNLLLNSNNDKKKADDATQKANEAGAGPGAGGGGSGATPDSAKHAKLACNAAGNNLYVDASRLLKLEKDIINYTSMTEKIKNYMNDFSLISNAMASGKKITSALGLKEGSDIFRLFAKTKITEASKMSKQFGEPETRIEYLSGVVGLAAKGAGESDSMTNPNLAENKNKTGSLSDDMRIFGGRKDVGSKEDDVTTDQNSDIGNETANLSKSNLSQMASTGTLAKLGKSKAGVGTAVEAGAKTKGVKGGDYLRNLAGKLNALGEEMKNRRDAHRAKLGLKPIDQTQVFAQNQNSNNPGQNIQVLSAGGSAGGAVAEMMDHLSNKPAPKAPKTDDGVVMTDNSVVLEELPEHDQSLAQGLDGIEGANAKGGSGTKSTDSQGIDEKEILDIEQYNKELKNLEVKEDDSIWTKLTKTYQRFGYPILMKRKANIEPK